MIRFYLIYLLLCIASYSSSGQVYLLDEEFNSAPTVPATLVGSGGVFGNTSSVSNYGRNAPSLLFNTNNQRLQFGPWIGQADLVSFFHKGLAGTGSTFAVEESPDGIAWTLIANVTAITTGATFTGSLQPESQYLRITFTLAGAAQTYFDDLRIRKLTALCNQPLRLLQSIINGSCGPCEGSNEFIYFETGSQPLDIRYFELVSQTVPTGGCSYGGNGSGDNLNTNWVLSSAYTASQNAYLANLNTLAGCPGVFVALPFNNIIPANAKVIAFTGATPDAPYNLSSICSAGTIYVVFSDQLNCGGKWANSGCSSNCTRYLTIFNHLSGCVDNEQYFANAVNTSAGNGYVFAGPNIGYTVTSNCSFTLLSVKITSFVAARKLDTVELSWTTASEENMMEYEVERSRDLQTFEKIGSVKSNAAFTSNEYAFIDQQPVGGILYYRLKMISDAGENSFSETIAVAGGNGSAEEMIQMILTGDEIVITSQETLQNVMVELYALTGQKMKREKITLVAGIPFLIDVPQNAACFIVSINTSDFSTLARHVFVHP